MAITGMTDSGSAVATAASRLPTAPSPRPRRRPAHSTELVKKNAPTTIRTNESASRKIVTRRESSRRVGSHLGLVARSDRLGQQPVVEEAGRHPADERPDDVDPHAREAA